MLDVEGFILVGGASSRMGSDKSQLEYHGVTAVERIAKALQSISTRISVVGSREGARRLDFTNIPDVHERWGALGGIHAALAACELSWAAIVACDLPLIEGELLLRLRSFANESSEAVVPIQPDGRKQPLCALYQRQPCLAEAERLIESGQHTPRALLDRVKTRWVFFEEIADLQDADNFFLNVNTPEDYDLVKSILAGRNRG
jgi:molybdopterin-guanine dinucleotide biosynthesis protein A